MFFSLLLIGAVAAVPNAQQDVPLKVALPERQPLTRGNGDADPLFLVHLNDTLKKYNSKVQLPSYTAVNKLLNTAWENRKYDEPLTDFVDRGVADVYYYGSIVVGQQQTFTVTFDTGRFVPKQRHFTTNINKHLPISIFPAKNVPKMQGAMMVPSMTRQV